MFDDFHAYFHENTLRTYLEYRDIKNRLISGRSNDLRSSLFAATSAYHLREHLPANIALSRKNVVAQCPEFDLLGNIVDASKHSKLTRNKPSISSATQIDEAVVSTEYVDDLGTFRCIEKQVLVKLDDGTERDIFEIITVVVNFWICYLHSVGVLEHRKAFDIQDANRPRSRSESSDGRLDLEMQAGVRFHQSFRMLRYNYEKMTREPIDLTGYKVEAKIYRPPTYDFVLSLTHNETGRIFSRTVVLTDAESRELEICKTDSERRQFLEGLPSARDVVRSIAEEAKLPTRKM